MNTTVSLQSINFKDKFRAFGIHFGLSLIIFLVLLYFIYFHWYPTPFFTTDGGYQGMRLIAVVDLVLGPTLTFMVFKHGKKGLKFDLTLIGLCQLAALVWGIWAVHNERPVALVFADDRLHTIPDYQAVEAGLATADLVRFGDRTPVRIVVAIPDNPEERYALFARQFREKQALFLDGKLYRPWDAQNRKIILAKAINMDDFLADKPKDRTIFQVFIKKIGKPPGALIFLPFFSRFSTNILVLDGENWAYVDVLDIRPPQAYPRAININQGRRDQRRE